MCRFLSPVHLHPISSMRKYVYMLENSNIVWVSSRFASTTKPQCSLSIGSGQLDKKKNATERCNSNQQPLLNVTSTSWLLSHMKSSLPHSTDIINFSLSFPLMIQIYVKITPMISQSTHVVLAIEVLEEGAVGRFPGAAVLVTRAETRIVESSKFEPVFNFKQTLCRSDGRSAQVTWKKGGQWRMWHHKDVASDSMVVVWSM